MPTSTPTLLSVTDEALARLQHLQAAVSRQIEAGSVSAATQREAASLSRAIIALGAEMRQQKKWFQTRAGELTDAEVDELVLDFLAGLSPHRKKRYREALAPEEGTTILS